jgi:hypothetical protein
MKKYVFIIITLLSFSVHIYAEYLDQDNFALYLEQSTSKLLGSELREPIKYQDLDKWADKYDQLINGIYQAYQEKKSDLKLTNDYYISLFQVYQFLNDANSKIDYANIHSDDLRKVFYNKTVISIDSCKEKLTEIYNYGYTEEKKTFDSYLLTKYKISNVTIPKYNPVTGVNTLDYAFTSNSVENGRVYRLNRLFSVLQSTNDGCLVTYSDSYNSYIFHLQTTKMYPDGYRFTNDFEIIICRGLYDYESILGKKRVYDFVNIPLNTDYYFLFSGLK